MLFWSTILLGLLPLLAFCAEDYYKLLGIGKSATDREIKKAYRRLSKQYHPDKNPGDEAAQAKFVAIADAYDALSDAETRRIYDQYGHEGVQQHKQGGGRQQHHDPFDLFSRFFGGSGHFGHSGERRGPNKQASVAIPLRDFYNGAEKELNIEKQVVCSTCEGSGSEDGKVETCGNCGGSGRIIQKHMLAPGIFQQVQSQCGSCGGKGKAVRNPCKVCHGQRVIKEQETMMLHLERGFPDGGRVTYENEADESPDWEAGDLFLDVHMEAPSMNAGSDDPLDKTDGTFFRRRGKDLFWREVLSLREAWMGDWTRNITHLDGHIVQLSRKRGEVVQPGLVEAVENEGMPIWREGHVPGEGEQTFGTLHVEYLVVLPDQMESGMEKEFWGVWDKWRKKKGVDLGKDSGRPAHAHDEL